VSADLAPPLMDDGWPDPIPPRKSDDPTLSPDRRRTIRQAEQIAAGKHPLMGGPLHPFASPETCTPDAPRGQPFTCGSCRFRELMRWHDRTYPKCVQVLARTDQDGGDAAERTVDSAWNISHGAATDVRRWWPGCVHYEAGDTGLSPDAARIIP